ncbi:MAG: polysaccharide deacetylase family protein [Albidovulum sp.]
MTDIDAWQRLEQELDRWGQQGRRAVFWLRDDDAVEPTEALDQLLDLTRRFDVSPTLAVIPEHTGPALARRLERSPQAIVALHGWSHQNHAPAGQKKQELGLHRPIAVVLDTLRRGADKLSHLHRDRFAPMLVPPWNRIDNALLAHLGATGITALSVFGHEGPAALRVVNTHVDVIDWKGTRGGRGTDILVDEILGRLTQIEDADATVGILTHHLVHDEQVWRFLEQLFAVTARHPACHWAPISKVLGGS